MRQKKKKNLGRKLLIQFHTNKFDIEENINYYSYKDFLKAKKKYLKYVFEGSFDAHANHLY
jgi:hypothetical protein